MCARSVPVIGVPADRRILEPHPFHMVGEKYLNALVLGANALPMMIPVLADGMDLKRVLEACDGILLTGSPSNVEPEQYDGGASRPGTLHDPERDAVTLPLARLAIESGVPLLAVCRGFQELNVSLGGTLHQHLDEVAGLGQHKEHPEDPLDVQYGPAHPVSLMEGGLLARLQGGLRATVNSLHGQGIKRLADGVTVEAVADDGLVEAFTVDSAETFALAVQWHPEWKVLENPLSSKIFQAFGDACRAHAAKSTGGK